MDNIFPTLFALYGDREIIPNETQTTGRVSFEQGFTSDYEKDLTKDPDAKDIERKKLNYLFYTICAAINKLQKEGGSVVGVPIPYPSTVMPEGGFVPYDGRQFDTNLNPILRSLFPSGFLPDIRGISLRAWDAYRGMDPGRVLLSYQEDAMQRIQGRFTTDNYIRTFEGAFADGGGAGKQSASGHGGAQYVMFDSARVVRTANETRVKNMAFYYITKVG